MTKRKIVHSISISRIISASFCERKMLLDCRDGQKRTAETAARARAGEAAHKQFENEGKALAARDSAREHDRVRSHEQRHSTSAAVAAARTPAPEAEKRQPTRICVPANQITETLPSAAFQVRWNDVRQHTLDDREAGGVKRLLRWIRQKGGAPC
jgi:hypothetical protein